MSAADGRAPHHDGSALHVSTDAPAVGERVGVLLRVPAGREPDGVWVRSLRDAEPFYDEARRVGEDDLWTWYRAEVTVHNPVTRYRWLLGGPGGRYGWVTGTGEHAHDVPDAEDFTLSGFPPPPSWAADALVYQVFPDRFARSAAAEDRETPGWALRSDWDDPVEHRRPQTAHQLYGGDLDGLAGRLDHVVGLGFDTVYLTPFFPAGSTHRYDATTFDAVDPLLGGDAALARLTAAAHARGLRVVGDLTTNHTGDGHEWFRRAVADPSSPERGLYHLRDDGSYVGWYDQPTLPKLRFSPALAERLLDGPGSVVGRWLLPPYALDGWRIDVANMTARHRSDDDNLAVARAIRRTLDTLAPHALLLAEHCHDASGDLSGEGWHGAMNYAGFLRPVWSWLRSPSYDAPFLGLPVAVPRLPGTAAAATVRRFQAVTPWRALTASWSLIGSHDTPRVRTVLGDAATVAVAAGMLFTFPGAPMVFMGDELGGTGVDGEDARRPMPWDHPGRWDRPTLAAYRALARLRRRHHALRRGGFRWVHTDPERLLYVRESSEETLVCLAVRGSAPPAAVPAAALGLRPGEAAEPLHGTADALRAGHDGSVVLPGDGPGFAVWRAPGPGGPA